MIGGHSRPQIIQILRKANVARGDFQRTAQDELPDEKKGHQSSKGFPAETVAQINITAARTRHGRAEFAPDQRVRDSNEHGHHPTEHRLRPLKRRHERGDRDERPDADHVGHV